MRRTTSLMLAACVALPLAGCAGDDYGPGYAPPPPSGYYAPPPPPPADYQSDREYREQPGYDRRMSREDYVYRGNDGRYYCRRSDGTTGTVVGAGRRRGAGRDPRRWRCAGYHHRRGRWRIARPVGRQGQGALPLSVNDRDAVSTASRSPIRRPNSPRSAHSPG